MRLCRCSCKRFVGTRKVSKIDGQDDGRKRGEAAAKDDEEYRRRSPVAHVAKLRRPLLVHGNTIDETVRIVEVNALVKALQSAGKTFEHKIYEAAPGGHHFNRIDTKLAGDSRAEVYAFLRRYLQP